MGKAILPHYRTLTRKDTAVGRRKKSDEQRLAEALGLSFKPDGVSTERGIEQSRNMEAGIEFFKAPDAFTQKNCTVCGQTFAVNRNNVGRCSDACRITELERLGIRVDFHTSRDVKYVQRVWNNNEPLIVPPDMLAIIIERFTMLQNAPIVLEPEPFDEWGAIEDTPDFDAEPELVTPEGHKVGGVDFNSDEIDMSFMEGL